MTTQTKDPILNNEVFGWIKELLPGASPTGAYAMGMGSAACLAAGVEVKRYFLTALLKTKTPEAAVTFIADWIEAEIAKRDVR